jgi:primary-amine oxidase
VALLKSYPEVGPKCRFVSVALHEPPKNVVASFQPGASFERQAFVILLDNASGNTYEAVVSLSKNAVTSWQHIPGVQPA